MCPYAPYVFKALCALMYLMCLKTYVPLCV